MDISRVLLASALSALAFAANAGQWLDEAEITLDPPDGGQQIVNVRLAPSSTVEYEQLRFECVYRQELKWKDDRGRESVKVVEPVTFTYRRPDVKLVQELDFYCSFRAPSGLEKLVETYGKGVFGPDAPVVIDRLRISGIKDGKTLWREELKTGGVHRIVDAPAKKSEAVKKPPKKAEFGEIDLD